MNAILIVLSLLTGLVAQAGASSVCTIRKAHREFQLECLHGHCGLNGWCVCEPCWTGLRCDSLENHHVPQFDQDEYTVRVRADRRATIDAVRAYDDDRFVCSRPDCVCAQIHYWIEAGNELSLFAIDPDSGAITFQPDDDVPSSVSLLVGAANRRAALLDDCTLNASFARLVVHLGMHQDDDVDIRFDMEDILYPLRHLLHEVDGGMHHRSRRALSDTPSVASFSLDKLSPWSNKSEVRPGQRIPLRLTIALPVDPLGQDLNVELLAPTEGGAVFTIVNARVSFSDVAGFSPSSVATQYSASQSVGWYDRAVLQMGHVACVVASSIQVDFDAVVLDQPGLVAGEQYWLSAAAEWGPQRTWLGEVAFVARRDPLWAVASPTFNVSGPSAVRKGYTANWALDVALLAASSHVVVEVSVNDATAAVLSVDKLSVGALGANYDYFPPETATLTRVASGSLTTAASSNGGGSAYRSAALDLGTLVNMGYRNNDSTRADNLLSIDIAATLLNVSAVNIAATYSLLVAVRINADWGNL